MDCMKKNTKILFLVFIFAVTTPGVFAAKADPVGRAVLDQRELTAEYLLTRNPYIIIASSNVNRPGALGLTALHHAARDGYAGFIENLLKCGADPSIIDSLLKIPPLFYAVMYRHLDCVYALTERKEYARIIDLDGTTALHVAALTGYTDAVRLLIQRGAVVNAQNGEHKTPLFYAVISNHKDCVAVLLKYGAML